MGGEIGDPPSISDPETTSERARRMATAIFETSRSAKDFSRTTSNIAIIDTQTDAGSDVWDPSDGANASAPNPEKDEDDLLQDPKDGGYGGPAHLENGASGAPDGAASTAATRARSTSAGIALGLRSVAGFPRNIPYGAAISLKNVPRSAVSSAATRARSDANDQDTRARSAIRYPTISPTLAADITEHAQPTSANTRANNDRYEAFVTEILARSPTRSEAISREIYEPSTANPKRPAGITA